MSPQRRDVLRAGGVAAFLTTGLAGCVEELPAGSDETPPEYANWLFDTDALFDADMRGFYSVSVDAYQDQRAALPADSREAVERLPGQYEGLTLEDFDRVTGLGAFADPSDEYGDEQYLLTSVMTGSFDTAAAREALAAEGSLSAAGSHEGYELFAERESYDPSRTRAAAVSEDAVILALAEARDRGGDDRESTPSGTPAGGVSAGRAVELHIDAEAGEADRLAPASEPLSELAATLDGAAAGATTFAPRLVRERTGIGAGTEGESASGGGSAAAGAERDGSEEPSGTPPATTPTVSADDDPEPVPRHLARTTQGLAAVGASADAADGSGEVTIRLRYADGSAAEDGAGAVRDLTDALRAEVEALTVPEVDVSVAGTTVVVAVTGDPTAFYEELRSGSGTDDGTRRSPQVSFTFDRREDGRVTVTHDGGDAVGAEDRIELVYDSDGQRFEREWEPDDGSVVAGDSITTERPVTDTLRVVWRSAEGDTAATLGLFRPPEMDLPDVNFGYTRRSDGTVTVTHDGGDAVERGLVLEYDGGDPQKWSEEDGRIEAGDAVTTREPLEASGSLAVVWPAEEPTVIGRYDADATRTPTPVGTSEGTATTTPDEG